MRPWSLHPTMNPKGPYNTHQPLAKLTPTTLQGLCGASFPMHFQTQSFFKARLATQNALPTQTPSPS